MYELIYVRTARKHVSALAATTQKCHREIADRKMYRMEVKRNVRQLEIEGIREKNDKYERIGVVRLITPNSTGKREVERTPKFTAITNLTASRASNCF